MVASFADVGWVATEEGECSTRLRLVWKAMGPRCRVCCFQACIGILCEPDLMAACPAPFFPLGFQNQLTFVKFQGMFGLSPFEPQNSLPFRLYSSVSGQKELSKDRLGKY